MKKITLFLLILVLGITITTTSANAAFWSNWFKKDNTAKTEQLEQPVKKSLWNKVVDLFKKPEPKPEIKIEEPKPIELNIVETQHRIKDIERVVTGRHDGQKDLDFSFTQEELTKVVLAHINTEISKYNNITGNMVIDSITLNNHFIEIVGQIEKPISGNIILEISPTISNGQIKINIDRVKFKGFPVTKSILDKILKSVNINPDSIIYSIPNVNLTEIMITKNELNLKGLYTK
ncbi:MAG TPA: hypothetical protein DEB09_00860 [Candidatus Magasanikbacteria bacterium]|nr:hypothetical protein [Candidatus Magasanikbacteria bacterium]